MQSRGQTNRNAVRLGRQVKERAAAFRPRAKAFRRWRPADLPLFHQCEQIVREPWKRWTRSKAERYIGEDVEAVGRRGTILYSRRGKSPMADGRTTLGKGTQSELGWFISWRPSGGLAASVAIGANASEKGTK